MKKRLLTPLEKLKTQVDQKVKQNIIISFIKTRKLKKLTQKELAVAAGTTQSVIARFESGQSNPTLTLLLEISKALGIIIKIV